MSICARPNHRKVMKAEHGSNITLKLAANSILIPVPERSSKLFLPPRQHCSFE